MVDETKTGLDAGSNELQNLQPSGAPTEAGAPVAQDAIEAEVGLVIPKAAKPKKKIESPAISDAAATTPQPTLKEARDAAPAETGAHDPANAPALSAGAIDAEVGLVKPKKPRASKPAPVIEQAAAVMPEMPAQTKPQAPAVAAEPQAPIAPEIPVAAQVAPAASPLQPAAPAETPVQAKTPGHEIPVAGPLQSDIEKILQGVKLPERRDFKASADAKAAPEQPAPAGPAPTTAATSASLAASPAARKTDSEEAPVIGMHTLKQDLQHVVRDQKVSLVHAVALEQKRKSEAQGQTQETPRPKSHKARSVVFAIVLLLFLGSAALGGVFFIAQQQAATTPVVDDDSLVFAEKSVAFRLASTSPLTVRNTLAGARTGAGGTLGSITRIVPVIETGGPLDASGQPQYRPATTREFFRGIGARLSDEALRAMGDEFFFGIHTVDKNAPVLVVPIASYDHAFAGMLEWEQDMNLDLSPIWMPLTTLTPGPDGIPLQRAFTDVVMRNYDVRALKDDTGAIQLYYSFPTRDILVIGESPYSFTEILNRLRVNRQL